MDPVDRPLTLYQGNSFILETTFRDEAGAVMDLSSYAGVFAIRRSYYSDVALLRVTAAPNIIFDTASPNAVVKLSADQTEALPTGDRLITDWVYGFKIYDPASPDFTTIRLMQGQIIVHPSATRPDE